MRNSRVTGTGASEIPGHRLLAEFGLGCDQRPRLVESTREKSGLFPVKSANELFFLPRKQLAKGGGLGASGGEPRHFAELFEHVVQPAAGEQHGRVVHVAHQTAQGIVLRGLAEVDRGGRNPRSDESL